MITKPPQTFQDLTGWEPTAISSQHPETHGTTVLALRYDKGVLMLSDRRATMGNLVMYDHADKVGTLDDSTLIAISGSFARAVDAIRMLKHSFKYYRRSQLTEMSLQGKLQEISKSVAANMAASMEGVGIYIPILATYDKSKKAFGIYFFDGAGARFQTGDYAAAGSGSERIRGVFEYIGRTNKAWDKRDLAEVLADGLHMLDIAA
ncbi:MAG: proteasome subunit alpha, partial [Armatimonadetes bacterium]|nr:proteasome subunit alpha [Armatimonadota bacterium]